MTEAEIIGKAQAGDVHSFEALYDRHKRRIFSLCLRMTRNYAQAEDFTQEAFLQLHRKIAEHRADASAKERFARGLTGRGFGTATRRQP